jgi:hypothetical protein
MRPVLIFDRPFTNYFNRQYREVKSPFTFRYISDFKYRDDVGLIKRQYRFLGANARGEEPPFDLVPVIRRDRFLRNLEPALARDLARSAYSAILEVLEEEQPGAVIALPMDNYYLDLLDVACAKKSIPSINPVQSFLPGLTRITRRGEWVAVREPSSAVVDHYLHILKEKNFRPTSLSRHRTRKDLLKLYLKERAKKVLFETLKLVKGDPHSFHYNCIFPMPGAITVQSLQNTQSSCWFVSHVEMLQTLKSGPWREIVFLPLQFSPESSLDYNIADSRFADYEEVLHTIIRSLPDDVLLIVKEHPDLYGYRPPSFYKMFQRQANIRLVDVSIPVQELFEICQYVLVTGSASTGAEAVIKGNTVISLGGAFYANCKVREIRSFDKIPLWPQQLRPQSDPGSEHEFVKRIVANTVEGPYDFVRSKSKDRATIHRNLANILRFVETQVGR